ncbi:MAG TPA: acetolactate synthase large subunit [Myxococcota bacterium]|nr:acetolactate synthase large subunit [Myxococcota bacterium]
MNGAEALLRTVRAAGVDLCLANPGTTELPLVAALDAVPGVRAVLGLFEGVCTGAADGYGRMTGRPALTLLHLGPGLANGLANLHNARRAQTPVLNLVGDHATWHVASDPPLASDVESLARPMSGFVRTSASAKSLASDAADALAAAVGPPGAVATLVVPVDAQAAAADGPAPAPRPRAARMPDDAAVAAARAALESGAPVLLLLGGSALAERGLRAASALAARTGARLATDSFYARLERGQGVPAVERLPYFPEQAVSWLSGFAHLVLAGTRAPVAFFGTEGVPSQLAPPSCEVHALAGPGEDAAGALDALARQLAAPSVAVPPRERPAPPRGEGALDPASLGQALTALQPEGAIVVDEAATSGLPYALAAPAAPPHSVLALTGGSIGQGLPCAVGAALACPERRVVAFQADGSGLYTLQALWTLAREGLDATVVVCANRAYRILRVELGRAGIAEPGPAALALTDLGGPALDWTALSRGFGVPASRAETPAALSDALARSFATPGPSLIEAILP